MFCKYCGNQLEGNEKFCSACGKPTNEEKTDSKSAQKDFCSRCGQAIKEGDTVCSFCGKPIAAADGPTAFYSAPQPPAYQNQQTYTEKKGTVPGIVGLCLAIFFPIVGIILGIIAIVKGAQTSNKTAVILGILAIIAGIIMWILDVTVFQPLLDEYLYDYTSRYVLFY